MNDLLSGTLDGMTPDDTSFDLGSFEELEEMQREVAVVKVPAAVNEAMDDILCELRRKGVHISDRKYFGFTPIVQAQAWLEGRAEAQVSDLLTLTAYLWTAPEELPQIAQVLKEICKNPLMPLTQSDWFQGLPDRLMPQKDQVLRSLRVEDETYRQLRKAPTVLDEIESAASDKLPVIGNLTRDVFQSFYTYTLRHNEESELSPKVRRFNRYILDKMMQQPDFPAVKAACEGISLYGCHCGIYAADLRPPG